MPKLPFVKLHVWAINFIFFIQDQTLLESTYSAYAYQRARRYRRDVSVSWPGWGERRKFALDHVTRGWADQATRSSGRITRTVKGTRAVSDDDDLAAGVAAGTTATVARDEAHRGIALGVDRVGRGGSVSWSNGLVIHLVCNRRGGLQSPLYRFFSLH